MRRRSRALIGLALATACALSAMFVRVPLEGGTRELTTFRKPTQQNWFTVMGHVGRPQTYKLPTSSPSLVDFIRFAGDLKPTASGQIRVVRNGRVVIRIRYSTTSTEKLLPGDVVIVDGKTSQGRIFRGRNSDAPAAGPVQIGLLGVRQWPIVMETSPERATIHWINRQLGQHEAVAEHIKALHPRRFAGSNQDTRLEDGTVLIYEAGRVDVSRLPAGLPQPVDASRPPQAQSPQNSSRPSPPLPLPIGPGIAARAGEAPSATPGHSAVPTPNPITAETGPGQNRANEEFTRELLTHPNSVSLEPHGPDGPGRSRVSDIPAERPRPNPAPDTRIVAETPAAAGEADAAIDSSPAAPPFQSFIERPAQVQRRSPVPEITDDPGTTSDADEPGLVPEPDTLIELDPARESAANRTGVDSAIETVPSGPSLALQGAGMTNAGPTPDSSNPDGVGSVPSAAVGTGPLLPVPATGLQADDNSDSGNRSVAKNWPAQAITVMGSLGLIAAVFMILSILRQSPEPPRPAPQPVAHSDRYWLDRIINDEMPIDDEQVVIAADETLFGQPARLVRIDAAHASVPKPHFLKRGGESGAIPVTPGAPDKPQPEQSDDDGKDKRPTTYAPGRHDRPTTRRPGRPAAPARPAATAAGNVVAEHNGIVEEISADEETGSESPQVSGPKFRVDTAHPATPAPAAPRPKKRIPATRPGQPVADAAQTSQQSHGESPLDRILYQVDQGDRS